jgi:hypothetical protein
MLTWWLAPLLWRWLMRRLADVSDAIRHGRTGANK